MGEILVNATTQQLQHQPAVAGFANTAGVQLFLAVWADNSDRSIKGRLFSADGNPSGDEFVVNSTPGAANTDRQRPTIATPGLSGPVVAWIEQAVNPPGPAPHVKLRRCTTEGKPSGPEIQVSAADVDPNQRPAMTAMVDGGFIVTWVDALPDQRIRARRYGRDGTAGQEFPVSTSDGLHEGPIVTRLFGVDAGGNEGNYVVAWRSGGGALTFRIFNLDGTPVTGEIKPNLSGFGGQKSMTFIDDGRFVIAHVRNLGGTRSVVHANVFESNGASADIGILATTDGQEIKCSSPALAPLVGGRFLLVWVQKRADTVDTPSVRARVFSVEQADSVGAEVQANTTTAGDRFGACVTRAGGGFPETESTFIAWTDRMPDTSDLSVRARAGRIQPGGGLELL